MQVFVPAKKKFKVRKRLSGLNPILIVRTPEDAPPVSKEDFDGGSASCTSSNSQKGASGLGCFFLALEGSLG